MHFGLNQIITPQLPLERFFALSQSLGISSIEIRNDTPDTLTQIPAKEVRNAANNTDLDIVSINALYPFNVWTEELDNTLNRTADYANKCGAKALVMCPLNESREVTFDATVEALGNIKPILESHNLTGLVEPLGFTQASLRLKSTAINAIEAADGKSVFKLVHDTFHHHLAGESECFPDWTGLVHISGVTDKTIDVNELLDDHRVLIDSDDRLGNISQIKTLLAGGYDGPFSFEPFAPEIQSHSDPEAALRHCMSYLRSQCG